MEIGTASLFGSLQCRCNGGGGTGFFITRFVTEEFWLQLYTSEKGEKNKNIAATRSHIKGHFVLSPERKHVDRAVTCSHFALFLSR
jgi:hypothetical protein